jgi:hypothetical protein
VENRDLPPGSAAAADGACSGGARFIVSLPAAVLSA